MMDGISAENEKNNERERRRIIEEFYPGSLKSMMNKWKEFTTIQNTLLRTSQMDCHQSRTNGRQTMKAISENMEKLQRKNEKHLKQVRFLIYTNIILVCLLLITVWYLCYH